jgi:hypothetical protein
MEKLVLPLAAQAKPMALAVHEGESQSKVVREGFNDTAILESQVEGIVKANSGSVGLAVTPRDAIAQATVAARALTEVIESKPDKVVINGKTYLTLEDWQLLAHFYGLAARTESTEYVQFPDPEVGTIQGYQARAEVINIKTGLIIGSGEAMCLNDEKKWTNKPLYAIRSMAQTRACAKALRNILAFVPVLAGYSPTPAEEISSLDRN